VATHVAFLDEGKLLFRIDERVMGRFREVHVTLEQAARPRGSAERVAASAADGKRADVLWTHDLTGTLSEQIHSQIGRSERDGVAADGIAECFHDIARAARDGQA